MYVIAYRITCSGNGAHFTVNVIVIMFIGSLGFPLDLHYLQS